jgi:serine/threonine protein phosphatase PrpC
LNSYKEGDYKKSLEEVFFKIDEMMIAIKKKSGSSYSNTNDQEEDGDPHNFTEAGCTANVILITKDKIYCANSGDSRAVLC